MDDDRQPPQSYDTVAPAGVGATTSNQVSPGTIQEILATGDQNLIDQAFDQMEDAGDYDALTRYIQSLPDLPDIGAPVQASSPAGVVNPFVAYKPPRSLLVLELLRVLLAYPWQRVLEQPRVQGVMDVVVPGLEVVDVVLVDVAVLGVLVLGVLVLVVLVVVLVVLVVVEVVVEVVVVEEEVVAVVAVVVVDDVDDDDDDEPPLRL